MEINSLFKFRRTLYQIVITSWGQFKEDFNREFNLDAEETKVLVKDRNNSRRRDFDDHESDESTSSGNSTDNIYSSESNDSDDESEETSEEKPSESRRKCCLCCACFECCLCFHLPCSPICDKMYYKFQRKIDGCPTACPTLIPRSVEEEWRFKGGYGSRFAICECCASPGCIVGLKWLDTILCPLCAVWEIVKGIDFGYRRFRIQAYIYRHYEAERGFRTIWV